MLTLRDVLHRTVQNPARGAFAIRDRVTGLSADIAAPRPKSSSLNAQTAMVIVLDFTG